jgi:hypothetical protein
MKAIHTPCEASAAEKTEMHVSNRQYVRHVLWTITLIHQAGKLVVARPWSCNEKLGTAFEGRSHDLRIHRMRSGTCSRVERQLSARLHALSNMSDVQGLYCMKFLVRVTPAPLSDLTRY